MLYFAGVGVGFALIVAAVAVVHVVTMAAVPVHRAEVAEELLTVVLVAVTEERVPTETEEEEAIEAVESEDDATEAAEVEEREDTAVGELVLTIEAEFETAAGAGVVLLVIDDDGVAGA